MNGLSMKERAELERFLMDQERIRPSKQKTSLAYLKNYPQNMHQRNVLVGHLVRSKPRLLWYSRHVFERDGPRSLTKHEIDETVQKGWYLQNRNVYHNSKYGKQATNRGMIAPMSNAIECPKRRITNGQRTVVLSFCYPRSFLRSNRRPTVVTAYRN